MAYLKTNHCQIKGIAACVPKYSEENLTSDIFSDEVESAKFIASTGVERRRIADNNTTTADLCYHATKKLLSELKWNENEVDCLIFVSQTPDYIFPATSCILQDRLGFNEECYALDVSLGCSGWVYGMSLVSSLLATKSFRKCILLTGDICLKNTSNEDKSAWPLFGDAGTATAIEYFDDSTPMMFHLGTDGSGADAIMLRDGGCRNAITIDSFERKIIENGIRRNSKEIILNGMDVFAFGISKPPQSVTKLLERHNIDRSNIDYFIFHQANKFMNEKIRKKLKLTEEQVPYSLKNFGNTSSATIPLTMVTQLRDELRTKSLNMIGCGFGVGLSWGTVYFSTDKICVPKLIEI